MATAKMSLFLPTLLLAVFIQQCMGRSTPALSTPLTAFEQQYLGTEQEENENQDQGARMFEGDILITPEQLEDHYGIPIGLDEESAEYAEDGHLREKRGAIREKYFLWTDGVVPYNFHESVPRRIQAEIRKAIATIEALTCLKFHTREKEQDYVQFSSRDSDACASYIGRTRGEQIIELGPGCEGQGTILHEISHALGVWHEQSRPDRDEYVRVLTDNVESEFLHNFMKRNVFDVDSLGTPYDYGSVMHYSLDAFAKERGLRSLEITNQEEYERQGRPSVGSKDTLSKLDVIQLNRLYNCPGSGAPGRLIVKIEKGENLKSRSKEVFVRVKAIDDDRKEEFDLTRPVNIESDGNPEWNKVFDFGNRISWQFIEVSVWGYDPQSQVLRENVLWPLTFSVNPGHHNRILCNYNDCTSKLTFSMNLVEDCACRHGGTCLPSGDCSCPTGYGGTRCEYVHGNLRVFIQRAQNLLTEDRAGTIKSDPFVVITAYDHYGGSQRSYTKTISKSSNPVWNQWLSFGENEWSWFTVQVFDEGDVYDYWLSFAYTYPLNSLGSESNVKMKGIQGNLFFAYSFGM